MKTTVQARLDDESEHALKTLTRQLGLTQSEVIRESLRRMAKNYPASTAKSPKFIGIGKFDSGIPDLSTNKKYMEDFGLTRQQRQELEKGRKKSA